MRPTKRSGCTGFSMAELLIVISVIGILSAIAIPGYLNQKDKAIVGVTGANLNAMRSGLSQYAVQRADNQYPLGDLNYFQFKAAIPQAQLPPLETEAKILTGSFSYAGNGTGYVLNVTSTNRTGVKFTATQSTVTKY